jgi:hypothetical protein
VTDLFRGIPSQNRKKETGLSTDRIEMVL